MNERINGNKWRKKTKKQKKQNKLKGNTGCEEINGSGKKGFSYTSGLNEGNFSNLGFIIIILRGRNNSQILKKGGDTKWISQLPR